MALLRRFIVSRTAAHRPTVLHLSTRPDLTRPAVSELSTLSHDAASTAVAVSATATSATAFKHRYWNHISHCSAAPPFAAAATAAALLVGVGVGVGGGTVALSAPDSDDNATASASASASASTSPAAGRLRSLNFIADAAEVALPAVVNIQCSGVGPYGQRAESSGSGFIVSRDGMVVTNNHVVASARAVKLTLSDGRQYRGTVHSKDSMTDLAIVKITAPKGTQFPTIKMGSSGSLRPGEWVLALGSPLTLQVRERQKTKKKKKKQRGHRRRGAREERALVCNTVA